VFLCAQFFAVSGGGNIAKVTISGSSYMIDDMRWE
jgi:hypothetical protein